MRNVPIISRGYTLLELMIVVAILATVAAIAVPADSATRHQTLALAASQVADALRFARDEARRTRIIHGVSTDPVANRVRVFRLDVMPNPNLKIFDVRQPVSKQLYVVQLGAPPYRGVSLGTIGGTMIGVCNDPGQIAFDASGVVRCAEPTATRIRDASIQLTVGGLNQTVLLDTYTGRVSIQ